MTYHIQRVAVLGAGTMGAAIAAQAANAGLSVDLLDIVPSGAQGKDRNNIVKAGFDRLLKAKPPALMDKSLAQKIRLGNFEDDFDRLKEADWILEAIIEKLEPKQELMARVEQVAKPTAIISTNTSGLPIAQIAANCSQDFKQRFLGTHFFNPPRYLRLLEIIPTQDTAPAVVEYMYDFGERVLGKDVVIVKDTPNFIGNRIGSYSGTQATNYALNNGYGIEEIDALTGPLIGRPNTATFRLADQVGLDIMVGVAQNLYQLIPEDQFRETLVPDEVLLHMVKANLLGTKAGGGFYKRTQRNGKTVFDVLNLDTFEYQPAQNPKLSIVQEAQKQGDLGARLRFLISKADEDRDARYIRDTLLPGLAYAAWRAPEIAYSLADVDHAMEWGFGQEAGPFHTWDTLGVPQTVEQMKKLAIELPPWVQEMLNKGNTSFYKEENGQELVYNPNTDSYEPLRTTVERISLDTLRKAGKEIARNDSASLLDLGDGVLCFELHSQANAIDPYVVEMGRQALQELEKDKWVGIVIGSQSRNFCVGANLLLVAMAAASQQWDQLRQTVKEFQELNMAFRFSRKPVVAAPHGQTLGGGAEIAMQSDRVVAAAETYMGLVEPGVGLLPAGGGIKEMVRRIVSRPMAINPSAPPLLFTQKAFETIAQAKVSASALEARKLGFLTEEDIIVMNPDHVLAEAKRAVLDMAENYLPPEGGKDIYAAGQPVIAALDVGVQQLIWGGYATEYDGVIARTIARVLCGSDLSAGQWVSEDYILVLEQEGFLSLLHNEKTLERM
ncbi:MAG: 3-hydroxyacyl-CoA dehydrogenase/enoyl-CoA hydratase family protein, partial [Chloroflexota bacterium]|nr:3-hydroxyacyl-CoA dehydrogenase/enoyl-CoA hydratase family protein [Chloroflexota bacterium]